MNVNDILNKALDLLGITDVTVAAGSTDERLLKLVNALGVCYMQLITEFAPLEKEESITVSGGSFSTSSLTSPIFDVAKLYDAENKTVKCRLQGGRLYAEDGTYTLCYYYLPSSYPAIGGSVEVVPQVTLPLLARGVAAEYALESLLYEESLLHERKYKEGLKKVLSPHREKHLAFGRWI
ncbi:MAG TPA: hypothetical protein DIC18_04600 [Clostridiales bacterium]|nr:hypothetical protein [Clostridiales bacterium]